MNNIGLIGLGVMGRNLALNLLDCDIKVVAWNLEPQFSAKLAGQYSGNNLTIAKSLRELVRLLDRPRSILMMVESGDPIDDVLRTLIPLMEPGDIISDGGNSHFQDTMRRGQTLAQHQISYVGLGVSGGERGARYGPSIMAGTDPETWHKIRDRFQLIAAKAKSEPCAIRMGNDGAGHFVKMVHNGIEYADMQLIAESYAILKQGNQLEPSAIADIFMGWNSGSLESFLIELTALVLQKKEAGEYLVEQIQDRAEQKGTGRWTVQTALELGIAVPTIAAAVDTRTISSNLTDRQQLSEKKLKPIGNPSPLTVNTLADALYLSKILAYAQGMQLIQSGSDAYQWNISPDSPLRAWRGGCIIRARLLNDIINAYEEYGPLKNLIVASPFATIVRDKQHSLREVVSYGIRQGIALPAFSASLTWLELISSQHLPTNLIQAQRDAFGAHGYKKIGDRENSTHHTDWFNP